MNHVMICETGRVELIGNDTQLPCELTEVADAPSIAVEGTSGEAKASLRQGFGGQDDPGQASDGPTVLGPSVGEHTGHFQTFQEQRGIELPSPLRQGFGGQAPLRQGFGGQARLRQGFGRQPGLRPACFDESTDVLGARLRPIDIEDLIALDLPPRGMVLDPIIPEKGLAMLYGARSVGKTRVAHGIGYAVATGTCFLRWQAPQPRRVLVIDGELPQADLRQRVTEARSAAAPPSLKLRRTGTEPVEGLFTEALAETGGRRTQRGQFTIISADRADGGVGNIGSPVVQAEIESLLDGVELLILDNLSSLTVGVRENDSDAWGEIQEWLLRLRRRGVSVLLIHHAGKTGGQRGTSRREDVLDTSLSLRRPSDYSMDQGARFEVHLEKGRGVFGEHAKPFEAWLAVRDGQTAWTMKDVEDAVLSRVAALLAAGMSVREIAEEIGATKSSVHRMKQRIEREKKEGQRGEDAGQGEGQ